MEQEKLTLSIKSVREGLAILLGWALILTYLLHWHLAQKNIGKPEQETEYDPGGK